MWLFIYVNLASLKEKPPVQEFVNYFLSDEGAPLIGEVGYVELPKAVYSLVRQRVEERTIGSIFTGGVDTDLTLEEILSPER